MLEIPDNDEPFVKTAAFDEALAHPDMPRGRRIMLLTSCEQLPESALRYSLAHPQPANAKAIELKLRKQLAVICEDMRRADWPNNGPQIPFPKEALALTGVLYSDVRRQKAIAEYYKGSLAKEAYEWATAVLETKPDMAIRLCLSERSGPLLNSARGMALRPSKSRETGKIAKKLRDQRDARVASVNAAIEARLKNQPDIAEADLIAIAAEDMFGGLQNVMRYSLACQFVMLTRVICGVFTGAALSIESLKKHIEAEDLEFRESAFSACSLAEALDEDGALIVRLFDHAELLALQYHHQWVAYSDTTQRIQELLDQTAAADKAHKLELQLLNRQLKDQAADIKRLTGSVAAASAGAATAELHELRQQLSRAREESAKKDAHIEQLQRNAASRGQPAVAVAAPESAAQAEVIGSSATSLVEAPLTGEAALAKLQSIRGVLIGGHSNFQNKVRALLPDWAFYSSDDKSVDDVLVRNAEVVVLFTSHCNHPLSAHALRLGRTYQLQLVYASKVNPAAFVQEVVEQLVLES